MNHDKDTPLVLLIDNAVSNINADIFDQTQSEECLMLILISDGDNYAVNVGTIGHQLYSTSYDDEEEVEAAGGFEKYLRARLQEWIDNVTKLKMLPE